MILSVVLNSFFRGLSAFLTLASIQAFGASFVFVPCAVPIYSISSSNLGNANSPIVCPQFDESLGHLFKANFVHLQSSPSLGTITGMNNATTPSLLTGIGIALQTRVGPLFGGRTTIFSAGSTSGVPVFLPGETRTASFSIDLNDSSIQSPPGFDLSPYIGSGTFQVPVGPFTWRNISGDGIDVLSWQLQANLGLISMVYEYDAVPEPSASTLVGTGLGLAIAGLNLAKRYRVRRSKSTSRAESSAGL